MVGPLADPRDHAGLAQCDVMSYPLEAARIVREQAERDAQEKLSRASSTLERAKNARIEAARALASFRSPTEAIENGSAGQLQRAHEQSLLADESREACASALKTALHAERRAQAEVERARAELARCAAERGAVERHHEGWERDKAQTAEKKAEIELEESRGSTKISRA
jgi:hypothetical protein